MSVVGSIRRCMFDRCVGDVDGCAMGMWIVELCGVMDDHQKGFGEDDMTVILQYLCSAYI